MSEAESSKSAKSDPARSGNPAKRAAAEPDSTSTAASRPKPVKIGNRWAAPLMIVCAVIGLIWIVTFYTAGNDIPLMQDLGGWNLFIGMGFIVAAFGFAMKWE